MSDLQLWSVMNTASFINRVPEIRHNYTQRLQLTPIVTDMGTCHSQDVSHLYQNCYGKWLFSGDHLAALSEPQEGY